MSLRGLFYDVRSFGNTFNSLKKMFGNKKGTPKQQPGSNPGDTVAELALLVETLYNVLEDKGVFTQDEFKKKFDELDMQDGVKDGK